MQITQYTIRNLPFAAPKGRRTDTQYEDGFTIVELLVALIVSSIILAAVATLAFAMSTANVSTDDTSIKQAQVRFATLRISELIRHCKLICAAPVGDLVLWKADDNCNNLIDVNEVMYIERGADGSCLSLCEFPLDVDDNQTVLDALSSTEPVLTLLDLESTKSALEEKYKDYNGENLVLRTYLIRDCNNVQFALDDPENPPGAKFTSIMFNLIENGVEHQYQINNALHCWAGNLLNEAGDAIVSDDD
jgi:prepilin-type N-terminal cleavage/methylation domain-containing protein